MYSPQALWSAAHHRAQVVFFVFNNRRYGVLQNVARAARLRQRGRRPLRRHGRRPTRRSISTRSPPSMGVPSARADDRDAIAAAVAEALGREGPTLIEIAIQ